MLTTYKNFKDVFIGRLISNCGDSIYLLVISWYILEVTHSTVLVGVFNALIFLPNMFSFLFGQFIDRANKKKLLIYLELIQLSAVLFIIIGMYLHHHFEIVSLIIIFLGVFIAATAATNTYTVQDALIPSLVEKKDLPRTGIYMSFAYNGTDYAFTSISGILLSIMSSMSLMFVDVLTFIASIFFFSKIDDNVIKPTVTDKNNALVKPDIFSGFKVIFHNNALLAFTLSMSFSNFLFGGFNVYTLIIGRNFGGSAFYGILLGATSIGTLIGSTLFASLILKYIPVGKILWSSALIFGVTLIPVIFISNKYVFLLLWIFSFVFLGINQVVQTPILQAKIPHEQLGKVLSAKSTISISTLSIGSLAFGFFAKYVGWQAFMFMFGLGYIFIAVVFFSVKELRSFKIS
ncbi:MFS transporter [Weissella viridescens]|uniref:MFS transporter n=1 Tax=Weissella viridescens TaxID=1629 RepID=A0A3P2RI62_WEIVI|nr:MFS transporter [Weissella viridescens]RRG18430.1 MFS transporter [Weissella viridescens]